MCWPFWKILYFVDFFIGKSSISVTLFGKRSISLTMFLGNVRFLWLFLRYFESIQLIQSYRSFKVNRLSHLLYENELTHSPINSLGKGTESIQSILRKNESIQINQLSPVDWYTSLLGAPKHWWGILATADTPYHFSGALGRPIITKAPCRYWGILPPPSSTQSKTEAACVGAHTGGQKISTLHGRAPPHGTEGANIKGWRPHGRKYVPP